ncbi:UDP-glucose 6-dehydrogenase [Desulfoluna limicola]|uniref:UDP-glucose 6-dehydrogenase n=1 Tax=Desulfoluna limicola TaxID=2810562 RepID=A0ABM7PDY5_9BACT|nr:UDP-glucose/GDP-mannose dehydrogenase family protein [Desulfoluna limicola]BCS95845.1 UDP-glucose 6-dehydrogenase [Desulfoluna limicola]
MHITIIGTGYVGLVTGACFSEMGNHVTCVDVDKSKIENLKKGILPIYEPGLEPLVVNNHKSGLLKFTTDLSAAMEDSDLFFIAVGTPPGEDGSADLQYVLAVASEIGHHLTRYAVIVDKSTVPVGTADKVRNAIQEELTKRKVTVEFDVVSNPEFLKEGAAVGDFMRPDRVVIGTDSLRSEKIMKDLYAPFSRVQDKIVSMGIRDAEMTKYAANSLLATKISFMNEIAFMCEKLGVDVENVRKGIGSDSRIGYSFIYAGCGYGGSCFPKDVQALIRTAGEAGFSPLILEAVEKRNAMQKKRLFEKVISHFGSDLSGLRFGIWGLAFKPGTDDMREAPATVVIDQLINAGATVTAYDPVAMEEAKHTLATHLKNSKLTLADHQYDAIKDADAMLLVTEWKPFRQPDFEAMKRLMARPVIFDGRNQYNPEQLKEEGFHYEGIGR